MIKTNKEKIRELEQKIGARKLEKKETSVIKKLENTLAKEYNNVYDNQTTMMFWTFIVIFIMIFIILGVIIII